MYFVGIIDYLQKYNWKKKTGMCAYIPSTFSLRLTVRGLLQSISSKGYASTEIAFQPSALPTTRNGLCPSLRSMLSSRERAALDMIYLVHIFIPY